MTASDAESALACRLLVLMLVDQEAVTGPETVSPFIPTDPATDPEGVFAATVTCSWALGAREVTGEERLERNGSRLGSVKWRWGKYFLQSLADHSSS